MMKIIVPLMLVVMAIPSAGAADGVVDLSDPTCQDDRRTHCPCHPRHCYSVGQIVFVTGSDATGTIAMENADEEPLAYPEGELNTSQAANLVVSLQLNNASAGESRNVTIVLSPLDGIENTGSTEFTRTLTDVAANATVRFPIQIYEVWGDGDYLFPKLTMRSEGQSGSGYAAIQVHNTTGSGGGSGGSGETGSGGGISPTFALGGGILVAIVGLTTGWVSGKKNALANLRPPTTKSGDDGEGDP